MTRINKWLLRVLLIIGVPLISVNVPNYTTFGEKGIIKRAESFIDNGDYASAWRLLYDRWRCYGQGQAGGAIDRLEWKLLHDERSTLMQDFRDPERSILEKRKVISEILEAVEKNKIAQSPLLKDVGDPFVQIMRSSKLPSHEKVELAIRVLALVEKNYVAPKQQEELRKLFWQLHSLAETQFRQGQYRAALATVEKADEIEGILPCCFDNDLLELIYGAVRQYLQKNTNPLTILLRDPDVSFFDKRFVLIELQKLLYYPDAFQELVIQETRYTGSFIELIPRSGIKFDIWNCLRDYLEREEVYVGDEITPELVRSAFSGFRHRLVFPSGISFCSLHLDWSQSRVETSLQGTIPQQHLQKFYESLGFTPEMFSSQLKSNEQKMLSHDWKVTLNNVRLAHSYFTEKNTKKKGRLALAFQKGQQGEMQFYLMSYFFTF